MHRRRPNLVPGLRRRWGRRLTRRLIRPGRARRPSRPAFLTAARRTLPGLVVRPGPVAIGPGHRVWSARHPRLTPTHVSACSSPRRFPEARKTASAMICFDHSVVGVPQARSLQQPWSYRADQGEPAVRLVGRARWLVGGGVDLRERRPGGGIISVGRRSTAADVSSFVRVSRPLLSLSRLVEARFPANRSTAASPSHAGVPESGLAQPRRALVS